jgi:hypothetical protein
MQGIIKLLAAYFKAKKQFLNEMPQLDLQSRQQHPFFEQEAALLQTCQLLEKEESLNSLMIVMMQWYYSYVETKKSINGDHYVDYLETRRRMKDLEFAELELYNTYLAWLN